MDWIRWDRLVAFGVKKSNLNQIFYGTVLPMVYQYVLYLIVVMSTYLHHISSRISTERWRGDRQRGLDRWDRSIDPHRSTGEMELLLFPKTKTCILSHLAKNTKSLFYMRKFNTLYSLYRFVCKSRNLLHLAQVPESDPGRIDRERKNGWFHR